MEEGEITRKAYVPPPTLTVYVREPYYART